MEGKIILNLAISLDGYISDKDGGFQWILGQGDRTIDTKEQFDFNNFLDNIEVIVMGRKAYEDTPEETYEMFKNKKIYVMTRKDEKPDRENVEYIKDNVSEVIKELKIEGKNIWLFGGGESIELFLKDNLIDEYIVGIIPIILGEGRKLFLNNTPMIKLTLVENTVSDGIPMLIYKRRKE